MSPRHKHYNRILGVAPCVRGFGFALVESGNLVDWAVKSVSGDKNARSIAGVEALILHYRPEVVVLEDTAAETSNRAPRIRDLSQALYTLGIRQEVNVEFFRPDQIKRFFLGINEGTKRDIALEIAKRFPNELAERVPPRRRAWMTQDYRVDLFDAVALALMVC